MLAGLLWAILIRLLQLKNKMGTALLRPRGLEISMIGSRTRNLLILALIGPFTWWKGRSSDTLKMARLDRALCSPRWRVMFPEAMVFHPARLHSDHIPIVVRLDGAHKPNNNFLSFLVALDYAL